MVRSTLGSNVITQVAIVVRDIEKTARAFADVFGLEMPEVRLTAPQEEAHTLYRGEPTPARAKLAFFHMGSVTLELIEPVDGPSTWREFLDTHGEGIHHIAFNIDGMKDAIAFLESKGMTTVQTGEFTGGRYAYIDAIGQLGAILELLEHDQ